MAIKIVDGDLLRATENIIAHQTNCKGFMGSGVAAQIRSHYPSAYWQYKKKCEQVSPSESLLGDCQIVRLGDDKYIANLFGQDDFGRDKKHTNEAALEDALFKLMVTAQCLNLSVALPYKLGSDRGGADWNEVYKIIEEVFSDYHVTLYRFNG